MIARRAGRSCGGQELKQDPGKRKEYRYGYAIRFKWKVTHLESLLDSTSSRLKTASNDSIVLSTSFLT